MILEADGVRYFFHFRHWQDGPAPKAGRKDRRSWTTSCQFHEGKCQVKNCPDGVVILGLGQTHCSRKDQFSKQEGRIRSMTRALDDWDLGVASRDIRRQLWESYFRLSPLTNRDERLRLVVLKEILRLLETQSLPVVVEWLRDARKIKGDR